MTKYHILKGNCVLQYQPVTLRCTKLLVVGCVAMRHSYKPASVASTGVISKFHV